MPDRRESGRAERPLTEVGQDYRPKLGAKWPRAEMNGDLTVDGHMV